MMQKEKCIIDANYDQVIISSFDGNQIFFSGDIFEAEKIVNSLPIMAGGDKMIYMEGTIEKRGNQLIAIFDIPSHPIYKIIINERISEITKSFRAYDKRWDM